MSFNLCEQDACCCSHCFMLEVTLMCHLCRVTTLHTRLPTAVRVHARLAPRPPPLFRGVAPPLLPLAIRCPGSGETCGKRLARGPVLPAASTACGMTSWWLPIRSPTPCPLWSKSSIQVRSSFVLSLCHDTLIDLDPPLAEASSGSEEDDQDCTTNHRGEFLDSLPRSTH